MRNICAQIYSASDATSGNGSKIDANQLVSASFQVIISDADFAGSVKIQYSNDPTGTNSNRVNFTPTNWNDIPSASITITAGPVLSAGAIVIANMCYSYIRAVVTQTTQGTGTAKVNMNALGI